MSTNRYDASNGMRPSDLLAQISALGRTVHRRPSSGMLEARRLEEEERARRLDDNKPRIETNPRLLCDIRRGGHRLRKAQTTIRRSPIGTVP